MVWVLLASSITCGFPTTTSKQDRARPEVSVDFSFSFMGGPLDPQQEGDMILGPPPKPTREDRLRRLEKNLEEILEDLKELPFSTTGDQEVRPVPEKAPLGREGYGNR